ncbi:MAG TPA: VWA domain-containing protein [Thermoanaerobaculia bacterium]|nr:VWA domain-containing protein [Thermoanaerobaculia bacterium]
MACHRQLWKTRGTVLLLASLTLALGGMATAQSPPVSTEAPAAPRPELASSYVRWLDEVRPLITGAELALFLQLRQDYQRDAFIDQFWRVRDPYPETARNEMRERFEERVHQARTRFRTLEDDRSRILLVHGEPHRVVEIRCTTTRIPAIIWVYGHSDEVDFGFVLVFLREGSGTRPARLWRPATGPIDPALRAARHCMNGNLLDEVAQRLSGDGVGYDIKLDRVLQKPRPRSLEWVATFHAGSTDLPPRARVFEAEVTVEFLGRYQSRSVLQGSVLVSPEEVTLGDLGGHRSIDLQLVGEVVRDDRLLERFRYKFGFPETRSEGALALPLVFQRYLRPGDYVLVLRVEDLNGERFFRHESPIHVPQLEEQFVPEAIGDSETARIFADAAAAMSRGDTSLRIVPPAEGVRTGFVRLDTVVSGAIERVEFHLDGQLVLTKTRPPFSVELDLGSFPRLRVVRAVGFDELGQASAEDEIEVNAGSQRFSVRLVEPARGRRYEGSVLARAEVRLPEAALLERVEFFVNETKVATLFQEPFRQPLELPESGALAYVRAVGYLTDGNTAEDHVFVNAPELFEEVEVQYVELFASVHDRSGRPVDDLEAASFRVMEDGVEQRIQRFERVGNLPIHVGIMLDSSASMQGALDTARRAALGFLQSTIQREDRAAIITFNRFPHLSVKLTNDHRLLGGGLAGLSAEGQTALYDSVMFSLYYLTGVSGQRAILLLSDGKDEVSRFSFDETLEYARRAGVTVYTVGLGVAEGGGRRALQQLAEVTGGQSYFARHVDELGEIYSTIERDLRSQYLLAYQSTNSARTDQFRGVEVEVDIPGARVRSMSGYFP